MVVGPEPPNLLPSCGFRTREKFQIESLYYLRGLGGPTVLYLSKNLRRSLSNNGMRVFASRIFGFMILVFRVFGLKVFRFEYSD